jgi:hypothetical protein
MIFDDDHVYILAMLYMCLIHELQCRQTHRRAPKFNCPECHDFSIQAEFEYLNNIEFIQFLASLLESRSLARAIFSLVFFLGELVNVFVLCNENIHHVSLEARRFM